MTVFLSYRICQNASLRIKVHLFISIWATQIGEASIAPHFHRGVRYINYSFLFILSFHAPSQRCLHNWSKDRKQIDLTDVFFKKFNVIYGVFLEKITGQKGSKSFANTSRVIHQHPPQIIYQVMFTDDSLPPCQQMQAERQHANFHHNDVTGFGGETAELWQAVDGFIWDERHSVWVCMCMFKDWLPGKVQAHTDYVFSHTTGRQARQRVEWGTVYQIWPSLPSLLYCSNRDSTVTYIPPTHTHKINRVHWGRAFHWVTWRLRETGMSCTDWVAFQIDKRADAIETPTEGPSKWERLKGRVTDKGATNNERRNTGWECYDKTLQTEVIKGVTVKLTRWSNYCT